MMTKIQGYDFIVKYIPGSQLIIPDTLLRMPNPTKREDVFIDDHVNEITINAIELDLLNFSSSKQE